MKTSHYLPVLAACLATTLHSADTWATDMVLAQLEDENYFLDEVPMVLTATRLSQPQYEAPVAVTVIDRATIEATGYLDIPDLLRLVPGFQVAQAAGHTISATYHGLADETARRMQVMIDGRPVYDATFGGVRWADLPVDIEDVERIEVIRGPNAAAYGANAFLATVNVITMHPAQAQGVKAKALGGNKWTGKGYFRYGGKVGIMDYRLTLAKRRTEGFKSYQSTYDPLPLDGNRVPVSGERQDTLEAPLANFRGNIGLTRRDQLEIQLGYNDGTRGEGVEYDELDPARSRKVTSRFQQLRWQHDADDSQYSLLIYHTDLLNRDSFYTPPLSEILGVPPALIGFAFPGQSDQPIYLDYSNSDHRYEIEFQHNLRIGDDKRVVWGMSTRMDESGGKGYFNREDLIVTRLHRLFGNLELRAMEDLVFNLGATWEHSSLVGTYTSPRLAANYRLSRGHSLRASVSDAIRIPTVFEWATDGAARFDDGTVIDQLTWGNTDLKPEKLRSYEIGYLGHFPAYHLSIDFKAYHDKLRDRNTTVKDRGFPEPDLDGDGLTSTLVSVNSGDVQINGAEVSFTYRPNIRTQIIFNYAYARGKGWALNSVNDPTNPWDTEDLQGDIPTHTRSLFAMHRLPHEIDISALYYKVSAMRWLGNGDRLGPHERLDLRAAKQIRLGAGQRASVALAAQNVLKEYADFRDENKFDTRVYLELGLYLN